jgi:8-oxo-dGTP pyrophosphatase MutT (NUDIX family)
MGAVVKAVGSGSRLDRVLWAATGALRKHWFLGLLLAAGFLLRAAAQVGYEPALLFIDSKKYIFGTDFARSDWGSFDPLGYTLLVLRPVHEVADLALVAAAQHVLGMAMAVALYALMLRRGVRRWLAALAVAPVLLDAYQLNAEQTIMPDVLFEVLLVAGIVLLLWRPRPALGLIILAGLALGGSAPVRQVGEALIVPALVYVLAASRGWRTRLLNGAALTFCFMLPVVGYMGYSAVILRYGSELSDMGDAYLYGRTAHAADCATLKLPADERPLCPSPSVAATLGVDGLVNDASSPRALYRPVNIRLGQLINTLPLQRQFAYSVLRQQPLRVVGDIAHDSVKIFAVTRNTDEGDTPIWRWQFQTSYPYYPPGITHYGPSSASHVFAKAGGGGYARVNLTAATALRDYQLHGGYTPGPVFGLGLLAGLAGIFTYRRRRDPGDPGSEQSQGLALACLLITSSGVAVLLGADLYEFSWRYQLPALITLPIAGALGATAVVRYVRTRRSNAGARPVPAARLGELATAGSEQVQLPMPTAPDGASTPDGADIRTLTSGVVYEDHWMRLRLDEIERRDGSRGAYAFVEKTDFALVIPAENDGFHLVEEFRYPIGRRTWSFPQGGFPHGQTGDPTELARLELLQETGLRARNLVKLGCLNCAHGLSSQRGHFFLATGLEPGTPEREHEEQDMRQEWVPRTRFEEMITGGVITDDSTVAAYALLLLRERVI